MGNREAWQLDGEGLKTEVLDLARARHDLQSRMVHLVVEMFTRDALPDTGFRAIAQWVHRSTNLEIGECSHLVSLALLFMLEPVVAQSFYDGDIDALKAHQVAQFRQHPPKNIQIADVEKAREILLALASKKVSDCDGSPSSTPALRHFDAPTASANSCDATRWPASGPSKVASNRT
ncbi:DUF222 domain-containing protein [Rhodococcus sp. IEGM 1379]|uniref:DUF222 domain-containing protein n=1 Tax=Rhodococcus sp. IEGM 1379 TaxID=3047086 RepID=UPI0024B74F97|nr:DUF222 domain-containing protein [Rhodococcus sp. IEGM 1379]MDI9916114.1 DUF222 domain-containing protein [Rhodococcus sp. IEGM 1379]